MDRSPEGRTSCFATRWTELNRVFNEGDKADGSDGFLGGERKCFPVTRGLTLLTPLIPSTLSFLIRGIRLNPSYPLR